MKLSQTLTPDNYEFVQENFKLETSENYILGWNAYGADEWVKFYSDGTAAYSKNGGINDVVDFASHQDAVDFIRI